MTAPDPLDSLPNYYPISALILTAGQPAAPQFAEIRKAGCEAVINLAMPNSSSALADEAELVAAQGMEYIHLPVVWEQPVLDDLARFFAVMDANEQRQVFVHCVVNWRVSTFVYLYRVIRLGVSSEDALADLLAVWEPNATWSSFMSIAFEAYAQQQDL